MKLTRLLILCWLSLIFMPLFSQDDFASRWKAIDSLLEKNQTRTGLEKILDLQQFAQSKDNEPQLIKGLLYQIRCERIIEPNSDSLSLERLRTLRADDKPIRTALLNSLLAQSYAFYAQQNRWRILQRTETEEIAADFKTWDWNTFVSIISGLYAASLSPQQLLEAQRIESYSILIESAEESETYRPTLFDLLAHRALEYYVSSMEPTQPEKPFKLEGSLGYLPAAEFFKRDFQTTDTLSGYYQAIKVYQQLLGSLIDRGETLPLVDADLLRLKYVHGKQKEDTPYWVALSALQNEHSETEAEALVMAAKARYQIALAEKFDRLKPDPDAQQAYLEAERICEQAIQRFPNSRGAKECKQLLGSIRNKSLTSNIESVSLPNQPFRLSLTYKNIGKVWVRVIPRTDQLALKLGDVDNDPLKRRKVLVKAKFIGQYGFDLPASADHHSHTAELAIPAQEVGSYYLLISDATTFSPKGSNMILTTVRISSLSYLFEQQPGKVYQWHVRDRNTGEALEGVKAEIYKGRRYADKLQKIQTVYTEADGLVSVSLPDRSTHIYAVLSRGDDTLRTEHAYLSDDPGQRDRTVRPSITFFTDRPIYRPGQLIHFKGILTHKPEEDQPEVIEGRKVEVQLLDVNRQEVDRMELTTNAYGSITGTFTAPNGLTGQFSLKTPFGQQQIRVEEYKRPTFETELLPFEGEAELDDVLTIPGKAMTYSGVPLAGATVSYRVTRQARFPYWGWWRGYQPASPSQQVASGEVTVQDDGSFEIDFEAQPDPSISQEDKPVFTYQIMADVTDISGETHSASSSVRLGYVGLEINISMPDKVYQDDLSEINVRTQNLNGQFVATEGKLLIERLNSPTHPFRARMWSQPDQFLYSEAEFSKLFPFDLRDKENEAQTWEVMASVSEESLQTTEAGTYQLPAALASATPGTYRLTFSTAEGLEQSKLFTLERDEDSPSVKPSWLEAYLDQIMAEPGETVTLRLRGSEGPAHVRYSIWCESKKLDEGWVELQNGLGEVEIPITEAHRGGIHIRVARFRANQVVTKNVSLSVPWSNKKLSMRWETFRSPLLPGQKEEWKLILSGPKAEAVAAELVATLYDASLESFTNQNWQHTWYYGKGNTPYRWRPYFLDIQYGRELYDAYRAHQETFQQGYDQLKLFGAIGYAGRYAVYESRSGWAPATQSPGRALPSPYSSVPDSSPAAEAEIEGMQANVQPLGELRPSKGKVRTAASDDSWRSIDIRKPEEVTSPDITPRTNLNETAFFFPQLQTNEKGEIVLSFSMPEALTTWRFKGFAHDTELRTAYLESEVITQKDLMLTPNLPRFFREGDQMFLAAKLNSLVEDSLDGTAYLELFDATNMQPIDGEFGNRSNARPFSLGPKGNAVVKWAVQVPDGVGAVAVRMTAQAGNFADGEERILPILSKRLSVQESKPFFVRGEENKSFTMDKLLASGQSSTLQHQQVKLEVNSNPLWTALQALPYLMEFPYECTEQMFSRYYANAVAAHVLNQHPRIQQVFSQWRELPDQSALSATLERNQDLKQLLLSETPWVLQAKSDAARKQRLGLLFDLNHMAQQQSEALTVLKQRQNTDGGFSWFPGMRSSAYVTQLIMQGYGRMQKLGIIANGDPEQMQMVEKAFRFLNQEMVKLWKEHKKDEEPYLSHFAIQYLYTQSFFPALGSSKEADQARGFYADLAAEKWAEQTPYLQGMLMLAFQRSNRPNLPQTIANALIENTVRDPNLGYYWKANGGWYWYQAPIEQQALLIEAFSEIEGYEAEREEMRIWLLQQKRAQAWPSTRATVDAVHALLLDNLDALATTEPLRVKVGGRSIQPDRNAVEAGTGAFSQQWIGKEVSPSLGEVSVKNPNPSLAWGALHWQYSEELDKITPAQTPLSLEREVFRVEVTEAGEKLIQISDTSQLLPGNRIRIKLIIRADRRMSYVHLKDMRAAGTEPTETLSRYKYESGLGFYQSTRDAATHFFFESVPEGTHVLEYDLVANLEGSYSNGISTLTCFYAPEFTSHSGGMRLEVK